MLAENRKEKLDDLFRAACAACDTDGESVELDNFISAVERSLQGLSTLASLDTLASSFSAIDKQDAAACIVLEHAAWRVLESMLHCTHQSTEARTYVERITRTVATLSSSPRDIITLLLGCLDTPRGDVSLQADVLYVVLRAMPHAFKRLKRRQAQLLRETLMVTLDKVSAVILEAGLGAETRTKASPKSDAAAPTDRATASNIEALQPHQSSPSAHTAKSSFTEENALPQKYRDPASEMEVFISLKMYMQGVLEAVLEWPQDVQQEARCILASSALKLLAKCMLSSRQELMLPALPPAAQIHFRSATAGRDARAQSRAPCGGSLAGPLAASLVSFACQASRAISVEQLEDIHINAVPQEGEHEDAEPELEAGKALALLHFLTSGEAHKQIEIPTAPALQQLLAKHVALLLDTASQYQSVEIARKALALAVAGSTAQVGESTVPSSPWAECTAAVKQLLHCMVITMTQNPEQVLRNAATHAMNAVLAALQVPARLVAIGWLQDMGIPAVSALAIQKITQDASNAWPTASTTGSGSTAEVSADWPILRPALLPFALDWIMAGRKHSSDGIGLADDAEPVCAALNLLRYMLLREAKDRTNLTGVLEMGMLREVRVAGLLPLHAVAGSLLAQMEGGDGQDLEAMLAMSRLMEVLSRVLEVVEQQLVST